MTKVRPPLSIDGALGRIAGQLPGEWAEMAKVVDRSERTVRRWGDHDAPDQIPLPAAIALDIAYRKAGGKGKPLLDTYRLQLRLAEGAGSACDLSQRVCALIREGAEAQEKMLLASLPSASRADRVRAIRELEDVFREVTGAISALLILDEPTVAPP